MGCFHFWLLGKKLLLIFLEKTFCGHMFAFLLGVYMEVEVLDNKVAVCSSLLETAKELSKVNVPLYTHTTICENFNCSTSLQLYCQFFKY